MKAPCKDCADRSVLCHSTCPSYLRFLKNVQRQREQRQEEYRARPAFVRKVDSPYPM